MPLLTLFFVFQQYKPAAHLPLPTQSLGAGTRRSRHLSQARFARQASQTRQGTAVAAGASVPATLCVRFSRLTPLGRGRGEAATSSCALRAAGIANTAAECRGYRRKRRAVRCSAYTPVGLTRSLPLISPFGLPPAVSRAATLAAWVPPTHSTSVDSLAPARLGPAGLPAAASRAVSQTAWVPDWHEALARWCCSRPTLLGRGGGSAATS